MHHCLHATFDLTSLVGLCWVTEKREPALRHPCHYQALHGIAVLGVSAEQRTCNALESNQYFSWLGSISLVHILIIPVW